MRIPSLFICFLLCLLILSCARWPWGVKEGDPRIRGEEQFDPLGFPQDTMIITQEEPGEKRKDNSEFWKENEIRSEESEDKGELLPRKVYRVQFFATKYPDEASRVAESAANQFSQKTYIDYKTPYYWVRMGDCETKEEAEILLNKIKSWGYNESWVVEVEIEP
jgi:hypothetical protein